MRTAPLVTPPPGDLAAATATARHAIPAVPQSMPMDRDFILKNQIAERYLSGRLPIRGAQDFERYCREHPELIDQLGLAERVHSGLRLLEAGGIAPPWEVPERKWWERLSIMLAAIALALAALIATIVMWGKLADRNAHIASLQHAVAEQPLEPATSTRTIKLVPSRTAPSRRAAVTLGGGGVAQMADLKIDVSWSKFTAFRVTIDRQDQGRVAVLHYMLRDSNGNLHFALNNTALGPGDYEFAIEGLSLHGDAIAQAWVTVAIAH